MSPDGGASVQVGILGVVTAWVSYKLVIDEPKARLSSLKNQRSSFTTLIFFAEVLAGSVPSSSALCDLFDLGDSVVRKKDKDFTTKAPRPQRPKTTAQSAVKSKLKTKLPSEFAPNQP